MLPKKCPEIKKSPIFRAFLVHGANYRIRSSTAIQRKMPHFRGFLGTFLPYENIKVPKKVPTGFYQVPDNWR